ncbi:PE family protein [Mycobacterium sp.]|uniref:PE family protein n=1 Tax=Mycobacterium sp. TaxID=1785 RepID=UPI0031D497FE
MILRAVPGGLAATGVGFETLTAQLAAAHLGAAPLMTSAVPPAVDPVSLQTAAGFCAQGGEHAAVAAQCMEELGRCDVGIGESGSSYATGDAQAALSYLITGG